MASSTVFPAPLVRDLTGDYSVQLYGGGAPGLDLLQARVIWPAALGAAARASLGEANVSCGPDPRRAHEKYLFLDMQQNFVNAGALWLHQPRHRLLPPPASGSWAEVSHCYYYNWGEHVHAGTPMWLFATPGSGLSLNVGTTLVLPERLYGAANVVRVHKFLTKLSRVSGRLVSPPCGRRVAAVYGRRVGRHSVAVSSASSHPPAHAPRRTGPRTPSASAATWSICCAGETAA